MKRISFLCWVLLSGLLPEAAFACASRPQIFFHGGSSELTGLAREILEGVAADYYRQQADVVSILVVGHSDLTGSRHARLRVAGLRAAAARDFLLMQGVPNSLLIIRNAGSSELQIETSEGTREPMNRRVDIIMDRSPAALARDAARREAALANGDPVPLC